MKDVEVTIDSKRLLSPAREHRVGRLEMTEVPGSHLSLIILNQSC